MSAFIFIWLIEKIRFATRGTPDCFSGFGCFSIDIRFSAFAGFLSSGDIARLNAAFRKAVRWGIIDNLYDISNFINNTKTRLLKQIVNNSDHCLHHLLPERKATGYDLRKRGHKFELPIVLTSLFKKSFLIDFLYMHR